MISIIICSISDILFGNLSDNISQTIGVEYEIIRIDNKQQKRSIASAYNRGGVLAKYELLCFVHEDVLFKTESWGKKILTHFNSLTDAGVIGVAGSVYKTKMISAWWEYETGWPEHRRINIMQHYKHDKNSELILINPLNEFYSEALILDGVLLFTHKKTWLRNQFDEKIIKGFHGYDMDFCLQVNQSKKNYVVYDILIEHFSGGTSDISYFKTLNQIHKKWKKKLPIAIENYRADNNKVYLDSWKRLKKNMNEFRKVHNGFLMNISYYISLTRMLDKKSFSKEYMHSFFANLFALIRSFKSQKNS